jgi:1-phosphatidylinositol phosphodiesterase
MLSAPLSQPWRAIYTVCIASVTLLSFGWLVSWILPGSKSLDLPGRYSHNFPLAKLAFEKVLQDASPIFGLQDEARGTTEPTTATWMKAYSDDTLIVHMNIPGTHDAATWNYTQETQHSLHFASDLADISPADPAAYRCQDKSMVVMLEAGIRAFDLRYAYDMY